jgi:hypothetical protein
MISSLPSSKLWKEACYAICVAFVSFAQQSGDSTCSTAKMHKLHLFTRYEISYTAVMFLAAEEAASRGCSDVAIIHCDLFFWF